MTELMNVLQQLGGDLMQLLTVLARLAAPWWPVLIWVAWWLWAADWRKLWPRLAEGGWAPLVLIGIMVAIMWAAIAPDSYPVGSTAIANFWWQLIAVTVLIGTALFCGWLQKVLQWYPVEVAIEVPSAGGHDHGHPHDEGHGPADHGHGHAAPAASDPHSHPAH
jgi:hypothetical protein